MNASWKKHKTHSEKLRKPASFAAATVLVVLISSTTSTWFRTAPALALELFGFALVYVAAIGRVWCTLYIAGRKNKELCTHGPYELCRNPLYFFSLVGLVGICFGAQTISLAILSSGIFLAYYHGVIRGEEQRLTAIFGADYAHYMKTTPRFWPKLMIPQNSHVLQVDCKIFTRSLREIIWFLIALIAVEFIELLKEGRIIHGFSLPF